MGEAGEGGERMRGMVEAWSTFFGLVSEKISFFWAGQQTNHFFFGWSANKSTFFELVSEKIVVFWAGQRTKSTFLKLISEKVSFFLGRYEPGHA